MTRADRGFTAWTPAERAAWADRVRREIAGGRR